MSRVNVVFHWVIIGIGLVAFPGLLLTGATPDWWTVGFAAVWVLNATQLWEFYLSRHRMRQIAPLIVAMEEARKKREAAR